MQRSFVDLWSQVWFPPCPPARPPMCWNVLGQVTEPDKWLYIGASFKQQSHHQCCLNIQVCHFLLTIFLSLLSRWRLPVESWHLDIKSFLKRSKINTFYYSLVIVSLLQNNNSLDQTVHSIVTLEMMLNRSYINDWTTESQQHITFVLLRVFGNLLDHFFLEDVWDEITSASVFCSHYVSCHLQIHKSMKNIHPDANSKQEIT